MAEAQSPTVVNVPGKVKTIYSALLFVGLIVFAISLYSDPVRAWHNYLLGFFYFVTLALGGLFFAALQHATNAGWSVNIRRVCESLTSFIPIAGLLAIVYFIGSPYLYEWLHVDAVANDPLLQHKSSYLNQSFFAIRLIVFFGAWFLFTKKIVGNSIKQDETGDSKLTLANGKWSIAFLMFFTLSYSFFSVDSLMSLQPHWFSTIFGIYAFAGLFQSTMAVVIIISIILIRAGYLKDYVKPDHLHDLGKYMFAFTIFWAYIAYSQFMLIWYANLPEETIFFVPRTVGSWSLVTVFLVLFKFVVPFFALLPRWAKRSHNHLLAVSSLILVMQYVDLYWLIFPSYSKDSVVFGYQEIGIFMGFAGLFIFAVSRFFSKYKVAAHKDPRLEESMHHHVVY